MNQIKFEGTLISVLTLLNTPGQFSIVGSCQELLRPEGQRSVQPRQILLQQLQDVADVDVVQPEYNCCRDNRGDPVLLLSSCSTEDSLVAVLLLQLHQGLDVVDLLG